jgi:hypothetical protein
MMTTAEKNRSLELDRALKLWEMRGKIQSFLCSVSVSEERLAERDELIQLIDDIVDGDLNIRITSRGEIMKTVEELANEYFERSWNSDGFDPKKAFATGFAAAAPKWISVNTPPEKSDFYCVIPGPAGFTRRVAWCAGYYDSERKIWTPEVMFWIDLPMTLEGHDGNNIKGETK